MLFSLQQLVLQLCFIYSSSFFSMGVLSLWKKKKKKKKTVSRKIPSSPLLRSSSPKITARLNVDLNDWLKYNHMHTKVK